MSQPEPELDESLRSALKRSTLSVGASAELRTKVSAMLRAGEPAIPSTPLPTPPRINDPRVFGLPRIWGLAAALAMLLVGGSLIAYQLRDFLPKRSTTVARVDPVKEVIDGMVKVHQQVTDATDLKADLSQFQRQLPVAMPLATAGESSATLVGATVTQLNGRLCYAVRYLVEGHALTLITADARVGYQIPTYNQVEGSLRLVGGEREGYLVCLVGDKRVAAAKYQGILDSVRLLPSPSTQPVTSLSSACAASR